VAFFFIRRPSAEPPGLTDRPGRGCAVAVDASNAMQINPLNRIRQWREGCRRM